MSAQIDANACLTVDEAIKKMQLELDTATVTFDRWASQNPQNMSSDNTELRAMKIDIKMAQMRLDELLDMRRKYRAQLYGDTFKIPHGQHFRKPKQVVNEESEQILRRAPEQSTCRDAKPENSRVSIPSQGRVGNIVTTRT